jgi:hypothetical protein
MTNAIETASPDFMLALALALFVLMAPPGYAMAHAAKGDR